MLASGGVSEVEDVIYFDSNSLPPNQICTFVCIFRIVFKNSIFDCGVNGLF